MPLRRTVIRGADLTAQLSALREQLHVPGEFTPEVIAAAEEAARRTDWSGYDDATDIPLVTLDPPGSRDLDQAFFLAAVGSGFRVTYAIADVAAFVVAGGPIDAEAHARGETLYLPDGRVPLHPPVLSEGAASLLPDQTRPAVLWELDLDAAGVLVGTRVRRALVRSRAQLDYPSFEQSGGELVGLLRTVGELRQQQERERSGVSLPVPEQEVVRAGDGWTVQLRAPLPVEGWNAEMSLLTGMAAAALMLEAKVGLLRVMPPPDQRTVGSLRRSARALGIDWPGEASYAEIVRGLDASVPAQAAVLRLASVLFRGASYVAFDGEPPAETTQSAVAAPYAHATAPLRRLADRYVSECCLAACAGQPVPEWVRAGLPALPEVMAAADHRAHELDAATVDLAEALLLHDRVGEVFRGVVVEPGGDPKHRGGAGEVQVREPAVRARLVGDRLPLGEEVDVRLAEADVDMRKVSFTLA